MVHYNQNIILVSEQPPDAQVHDLASLVNVDAKNIDVEKLGSDCIKEQQAINLERSSNEVAIIPEDHAQVMLSGVRKCVSFQTRLIHVQTRIPISTIGGHVRTRNSSRPSFIFLGYADATTERRVGDPELSSQAGRP